MSTIYEKGTKYFHANSTEPDSVASGKNSIAVGPNSVASGENSVAQGNGATASGTNSVAIGANTSVTVNNAVALGAGSVADRANTVSVGSAGNERQITNVAAGTAPTDAVNLSQLQGAQNVLNNKIDSVGRNAYGGVASAMAMETAPYIPGAWTYAVGVGYYQQEGAVAVSVRKTADNARWSLTGGVSGTRHGGVGARLAVTGILVGAD